MKIYKGDAKSKLHCTWHGDKVPAVVTSYGVECKQCYERDLNECPSCGDKVPELGICFMCKETIV